MNLLDKENPVGSQYILILDYMSKFTSIFKKVQRVKDNILEFKKKLIQSYRRIDIAKQNKPTLK